MSSKNGPETPPPAAAPKARRAWSLALRLTAWYAGTSFLVVLVATGVMYRALVNNLDREDDEALAEKVQLIRALLQGRPGGPGTVQADAEAALTASRYANVPLRITDEKGRSVVETPGMGEVLPGGLFPAPIGVHAEPGAGTDVHPQDGKHYRLLAAQVMPRKADGPWVVEVALERTPEEHLLQDYRRSLWLVLGLALV